MLDLAKPGSETENLIKMKIQKRRAKLRDSSSFAQAIYVGDWVKLFSLLKTDKQLVNYNPGSFTALHQAAYHGAPKEILEKLVHMGADLSLPTPKSGETPYDVALRKGNLEAAKILQELASKKFSFVELDLDKLRASSLVIEEKKDGVLYFTINFPPEGDSSYAAKLFREISTSFLKLIPNEERVKLKSVKVFHHPQLFNKFNQQISHLEKTLKKPQKKFSDWETVILNALLKGASDKYPKSHPILAWHGTASTNIDSIVKNGFLLSKIGSGSGDPGFFGKGLYFTQMASYGEYYIDSRQQVQNKTDLSMLLCWVLVGNPFPVISMDFYGKTKAAGFTSHYTWVDKTFKPSQEFQAPFGDEIVIFEEKSVYPFALVEYDKIAPYREYNYDQMQNS